MNLYKELLLEHYRSPRHKGQLPHPSFKGIMLNPSCGDQIQFEGVVTGNRLTAVAFTGQGCVISQATASLLAEYACEKELENILSLDAVFMQELIGMQLGPLRLRCALLPLEALQAGVKEYRAKGSVRA